MAWIAGRKVGGALAVAAFGVLAFAPRAHADVYDLNTVINGGTSLSSSPSFGTVTMTDNGNTVDVTINLVGSGERVQEFIFNYDPVKFSSSTQFVLTGDLTSYINNEDGVKADGYTGDFDVQTPATGNGGVEPITFNIALAGTDLNPADFAFQDTLGNLFNAVHIGNCGDSVCTPGATGPASIWVGSGDGTTNVPEPASLAIFGAALAGLGLARRRRKSA